MAKTSASSATHLDRSYSGDSLDKISATDASTLREGIALHVPYDSTASSEDVACVFVDGFVAVVPFSW